MAMMLGGGRGSRGRRMLNAEINVTPFVDVMLVLLVVFMITAPMLVRGEEVSLPKTDSSAVPAAREQPLAISINAEGEIFIQKTEIALEDLVAKLRAITGEGYEELIYLRADERTSHGRVMQVVARVRGAGFTRIAMVTDPLGAQGRG